MVRPTAPAQVADELAAARPARSRACIAPESSGWATATLAGLRRAIANGYDFVINMDADFSHDPQYLPAVVECMERADVAIGSRYVPGGGIEGWGPLRHFMSRGINWYARLLLGLSTRDNSGAYRCYRVSKLAQIDLRSRACPRLRVSGRNPASLPPGRLPLRGNADRVSRTPLRQHPRSIGANRPWRSGSSFACRSKSRSDSTAQLNSRGAQKSPPTAVGELVRNRAPDGNRTRTRSLGSCRDTISPRAHAKIRDSAQSTPRRRSRSSGIAAAFDSAGRRESIIDFRRLHEFVDGNPFVFGVSLRDRAGAENNRRQTDCGQPRCVSSIRNAHFFAPPAYGPHMQQQSVSPDKVFAFRQGRRSRPGREHLDFEIEPSLQELSDLAHRVDADLPQEWCADRFQ